MTFINASCFTSERTSYSDDISSLADTLVSTGLLATSGGISGLYTT